jgi:hypothetical protein
MTINKGYNKPRYAISCPMEGSGFIDVVRSTANKIGIDIPEPRFPGERHAIGLSGKDKGELYEYAGPGTKIKKRLELDIKPKNKIDLQGKIHDISYMKIGEKYKNKEITKDQAKKEIWEADKKFKAGVEANKSVDPVLAKVAQGAISLKEIGERTGLLPIEKFSLSGDGKKNINPDADKEAERLMELFRPQAGMRLKAMARGDQSGGFAILPVLIPIIASLAGTALSKVIDKLTIKGNGKSYGMGIMSDEDKREIILTELGKMPKYKQIEFVRKI